MMMPSYQFFLPGIPGYFVVISNLSCSGSVPLRQLNPIHKELPQSFFLLVFNCKYIDIKIKDLEMQEDNEWELSKENIQPLKSGRRMESLKQALKRDQVYLEEEIQYV